MLQGRIDEPLDATGRRQARCVADALDGVARVISSPLQRTFDTASELAERNDVSVEVDERFVEVDYGDYDGTPVADISEAVWQRWQASIDFRPPGGETLREVAARVIPAIEELAASAADADVVVVSHVSPIKVAVGWVLDVDPAISWRTRLDEASITRISTNGRRPLLQSFNEVAHLR